MCLGACPCAAPILNSSRRCICVPRVCSIRVSLAIASPVPCPAASPNFGSSFRSHARVIDCLSRPLYFLRRDRGIVSLTARYFPKYENPCDDSSSPARCAGCAQWPGNLASSHDVEILAAGRFSFKSSRDLLARGRYRFDIRPRDRYSATFEAVPRERLRSVHLGRLLERRSSQDKGNTVE